MTLTFGQLAGLIAALAFLVLVIFLCISLNKLAHTITEMNKSINTLTDDADGIAKEVEDLVNKTNTLMNDVNKKSEKIEPVFDAAVDLGKSVSELNTAGHDLAKNVKQSVEKTTKASLVYKAGKNILKMYKAVRPSKSKTDSQK